MAKKIEEIRNIEKEVLNLTTSPLYEFRVSNNYLPVVGEGSLHAKIMFIGEAPGRNEAKTGRPFCGAAGKILDKLLGGVGIKRQEVYITNIIKDRPPKNRDPVPEEVKIYAPFLDRQIEIIKPKIIATLGRYAMEYTMTRFGLELELKPIGKLHGKSFKAKAPYGKIEIVILYHPCVAIYNPHQLPNLKKEFKILIQTKPST